MWLITTNQLSADRGRKKSTDYKDCSVCEIYAVMIILLGMRDGETYCDSEMLVNINSE